jgi:3-isopropylmalate/(R)-2-methylmalate dehydratase small subunit
LTEEEVQELLARCTKNPEHKLTINLEAQTVTDEQGFKAHFDIDPFRKYCLLNGLDDIGLTLRQAEAIDKFEGQHDKDFWSAPKAS